MMDVFFCYSPDSPGLRKKMGDLSLARWKMEPGVYVRYANPELLNVSLIDFQRERRIYANDKTTSTYYVVADDDCLLASPKPCIAEAVRILDEHPEFGLLGLNVSNHPVQPWTKREDAYEDDDVMEHAAAGTIRVCRKVDMEWPKARVAGYDGIHGEALRAVGLRTGYYKNIWLNHLGENYSTIRRGRG